MVDNLFYTQPVTGDPVATDNVDGIHFQKMKLDGGPDGRTNPITGTTEWGLTSDVKKAVLVSGRLVALSGDVSKDVFVPLDMQWAPINASTASLTVVVSGEVGYKIRVVAVTLVCDKAVEIAWKSGTTVTKIPRMAFAKNGGMDVNRGPHGWFVETDGGQHLCIDLSNPAEVRGSINYLKVPI